MSITKAMVRSIELGRGKALYLDAYASLGAAKLLGKSMRDHREELLLYFLSSKRGRFVAGHFYYSSMAFSAFGDRWHFLTLFREPVAKWFSVYFYNRYKSGDHLKINMSIDEYLETDSARHHGCDYVTSFTEGISSSEALSRDAQKEALNNIRRFSLVGILEELDTFTRDYKKRFGLELKVPHLNKNPRSGRQQQGEINRDIEDRVRELCRPNIAIYQEVASRIKTQHSWLD